MFAFDVLKFLELENEVIKFEVFKLFFLSFDVGRIEPWKPIRNLDFEVINKTQLSMLVKLQKIKTRMTRLKTLITWSSK